MVDKLGTFFQEAQIIYFYCKSSDPTRRTFESLARTLIIQILDHDRNRPNSACLDYLYDKMTASSERNLRSPRLMQEILEELFKSHDLLFCCIDGLDECESKERKLIFSLIGSTTKASRIDQNVRVFLTSRKESDIEKSLSTAIRLHIKPRHIDGDILSYLKCQVAKLRAPFNFTVTREQEGLEKLSSRPQGNLSDFRYGDRADCVHFQACSFLLA